MSSTGMFSDLLSFAWLLHDPHLLGQAVDLSGDVSVPRYPPDLWVMHEFLLQFLIVVHWGFLSCRQLQYPAMKEI